MNNPNASPPHTGTDHPDAAYWAAWALLTTLDQKLTSGQHLRTADGQVITTLDQLVNAILENRWPAEQQAEQEPRR